MGSHDVLKPVLIEKVLHLITAKFDEHQTVLVSQLAQHLFSNIAYDDLANRTESDLYGAVVSLWHHLNEAEPNSQSVRVFNPTVSQQGWQSTHTIIEMVLPDIPFLVDSIRMLLLRAELTSYLMLHGPAMIEKGNNHDIVSINAHKGSLYSMFHIEIDRINHREKIAVLKQDIVELLADIDLVVRDWKPMLKQLKKIIRELESQRDTLPIEAQRFNESIEFLHWIGQDNFVFMGYKEYDLVHAERDFELNPTKAKGFGLLADPLRLHAVNLADFPESARKEAMKPDVLILTKGNVQSHIHRPAYTDYIGVKKIDKSGQVVGEYRFTGLYTSSVYNQPIESIPLIREKVERIRQRCGYLAGSYDDKTLSTILSEYPRDELLQAKEEELLEVGSGVLQMQDRDLLRLFVRRDPFGRFFSCMVYVPKDRHTTELRRKTQTILADYFGSSQEVEYSVYFAESLLARTHYIVRVDDNVMDIDIKKIEKNLTEASVGWDDRLYQAIISAFGESVGITLSKEYRHAFPQAYKDSIIPSSAVEDIQRLEALSDEHKLGMLFYRPQEEIRESKVVRLKLYHKDQPIHLSYVMPMLENLGLRVVGEAPYQVVKSNGQCYWILDFSMLHHSELVLDISKSRLRFEQAFADIWYGKIDNDGFNSLVLGTQLSGQQVSILRAYARYMRQIGFPFSQQYIEETVNNYPDLTSLLVDLFYCRFDPHVKQRDHKIERLKTKITNQFDHVDSLDDDRILRRYMEMILATIRTNYFQMDKACLSFKMNPQAIPEIPAPVPVYEIFVYSPDLEGVHLRGGKVARGGIRWSDRYEDFRTEILGLVKAQQVKNTVIVPVGAKGGFICKKQSLLSGRDEILEEGRRCYQLFIRGLLDITDNVVNGEVIKPKDTVCHDDDDPYLVVAADKGTATFSDLANSVSQHYDFWLGDAFASGGSNGYDHKAMGITAKGAWESVKRHFRELGIDCQLEDFTVVGIGDMSGDVFGNGMLLSKHIKLLAAFNHQHIFIDPNPDPDVSWNERYRLFQLPRSSWEDYDHQLISAGGGIFSRRAKSIKLTPEIQQLVGTTRSSMIPNDLIKLLLTSPVDLLWNGGIGTYIKSQQESHSDVGDRANDHLRADGQDIQAKIIGEGGNLGVTQLGRVEYALKGGRMNTDFVDNVGGVDCSDNEVNIKILLNGLVVNGDLTFKQRNQLLQKMQEEVGVFVVSDAYRQAESISVTARQGGFVVKELIRFIHYLEKNGLLDRHLEHVPDDESLIERAKRGQSFTRPELAVLVAYAKMHLKQVFADPRIASDAYHSRLLASYFPSELQGHIRAGQSTSSHPLTLEIIATMLANQVVNEMGCNFVARLQEETGASPIDIVNAYSVVRDVFKFEPVIDGIRRMDNQVDSDTQYDMLIYIRRVFRQLSRWILRNHVGSYAITHVINRYKKDVETIASYLCDLLVDQDVEEQQHLAEQWIEQGMDSDIAQYVSRLSRLISALDISVIAKDKNIPVLKVAKLYYHLGDRLSLHWFLNQINHQAVDNHWQALARASFREDLDWQQRQLTAQVLGCDCRTDESSDELERMERWISNNAEALKRWEGILKEFNVGTVHEFAKFSVALRELALLNLNCS